MDINQKISAYHGKFADDPHQRYRSWEHCYGFFRRITPACLIQHREHAALHLGFYLASWGMYRNSFLLQHAYSVHLPVVDCLASPIFTPLWENDVGSKADHSALVPIILAAVKAVKEAYRPFGKPTDTLVTKVLLGTLGCLPACDRFFLAGFKSSRDGQYSYLNAKFVERVLKFCFSKKVELRNGQTKIEASGGVTYPFMKLVDMYFWQIGYEASMPKNRVETPIIS